MPTIPEQLHDYGIRIQRAINVAETIRDRVHSAAAAKRHAECIITILTCADAWHAQQAETESRSA